MRVCSLSRVLLAFFPRNCAKRLSQNPHCTDSSSIFLFFFFSFFFLFFFCFLFLFFCLFVCLCFCSSSAFHGKLERKSLSRERHARGRTLVLRVCARVPRSRSLPGCNRRNFSSELIRNSSETPTFRYLSFVYFLFFLCNYISCFGGIFKINKSINQSINQSNNK